MSDFFIRIRGIIIHFLSCFAFSLVVINTSFASWREVIVEETHEINSNSRIDIAIDKKGFPHTIYGDKNIKYAYLDENGWHLENIVELNKNGTTKPKIAIDNNGKAHIAYYDTTQNKLAYTTNSNNQWSTFFFDYNTHCEAITVDSNYVPHLIINTKLNSLPTSLVSPIFPEPTYEYAYHLTNSSGAWDLEQISTPGRTSSIISDPHNNLHVLINHGSITYINNITGVWESEVVSDNWALNGITTWQFKVDENNFVHIVYQESEGAYYDGSCYGDCDYVDFNYATNSSGIWEVNHIATTNHFPPESNTITHGAPRYFGLGTPSFPQSFEYIVSKDQEFIVDESTISIEHVLSYEIFSNNLEEPLLLNRNVSILNNLFNCKTDSSGKLHIIYFDKRLGQIVYLTNQKVFKEELNIVDTDSDGINDNWEIKWFDNLLKATQKSDFDKDNYSDLQEYLNDIGNEIDPDGSEYDPKIRNAPGGTGYIPHSGGSDFWNLMLPAILGGSR